MIVPSIDIVAGTTVQLVGGEEQALDAGDPIAVLERLSVVGEVAVVDIDAARGEGENREVIARMCGLAPIRVGGGIRDAASAIGWLDAGAVKVIIGTAADERLLAELPKERTIVALDARHGEVLTHGWRRETGRDLLESIARFRDLCGGFLVSFVEREGRMEGTDLDLARRVVESAGDTPVTIAGGVTTTEEIVALDRIGADAQIGMALYTGRLDLGEAFAAPLISDRPDGLWPTVVADAHDRVLGLVYSSRRSLRELIESRSGVYESRKKGRWVKGETSGNSQDVIDVAADCDRDAIRVRVRQQGCFCHTGTRTCWGEDHGLARLDRRIRQIAEVRPAGSNTLKLLDEDALLDAKILEEAAELTSSGADIVGETADLVYFALVKSVASGFGIEDLENELDRREQRVSRRPMRAKE